jgi:antirestriction protein ArdC
LQLNYANLNAILDDEFTAWQNRVAAVEKARGLVAARPNAWDTLLANALSAVAPNRSPASGRPTRCRKPDLSLCRELPMKSDRFDIHEHITDKIVNAIERGAGEFRLPWHRADGGILRPVNVASKKAYRGVNVVALWAYAEEFGYSAGVWGTYRQWSQAGAQVRMGEKDFVVFYKEFEFAADPETGDADTATRLFARATPVFAAEQVSGFMPATVDTPPITVITPIEQAEAFVAATGASIHHGGGRAFYRPSTDSIHLPPREAFIGTPTSTAAESYFSTLCHELCHWTSRENRCNRQLGKRFGDQAYAMEELVAELGAAFLCADLQKSRQHLPS